MSKSLNSPRHLLALFSSSFLPVDCPSLYSSTSIFSSGAVISLPSLSCQIFSTLMSFFGGSSGVGRVCFSSFIFTGLEIFVALLSSVPLVTSFLLIVASSKLLSLFSLVPFSFFLSIGLLSTLSFPELTLLSNDVAVVLFEVSVGSEIVCSNIFPLEFSALAILIGARAVSYTHLTLPTKA